MKIFEKFIKFRLKNCRVNKTELVNEPFEKVCFFSNTAIGDTLFNTPVFRVFKQNFPHVKVTAILNPSSAALFRDDPNLDEILTYDGKWIGFFKILRDIKMHKIDIAFLLHSNEPQATPLAVLSGAKHIFKLPNLTNDFNKFHSNSPQPYGNLRYVALNRLDQLKFVGIHSSDTRLNLFLNSADYEAVDLVLKRRENERIIGFQMGASTRSRQWFLSRWSELAKLILLDQNTRIVLCGAPNEKSMADEFCAQFSEQIRRGEILNLVGHFSLRSAAALIGRLDALITPDTGPLHIAAALQTPTIGLFAVAEPINSNPDFDKHIHKFIKKPIICEPCIAKRCRYQKCMLQIEASEVYAVLKELL